MSTPTFINLPPPPSEPVTPSDMGPGTPNSTTTSMSALSTTAIKDGHQGHAPPHMHSHNLSSSSTSSANTLDNERADRISRLAGLERVATVRGPLAHHLAPNSFPSQLQQQQQPPPGYFDNAATPLGKERSTVGSASATGSVGGRTTTWASGGSDVYDADKMSEDQDDAVSSSAGLSDEGNASLVGFGEAASTGGGGDSISGRATTASAATAGTMSASRVSSPTKAKFGGSPMQGVLMGEKRRGFERDGSMTGREQAERIMRERLDGGEVYKGSEGLGEL